MTLSRWHAWTGFKKKVWTHEDGKVVAHGVGEAEVAGEEALVQLNEGLEEFGMAAEDLHKVVQSTPAVPILAEEHVGLKTRKKPQKELKSTHFWGYWGREILKLTENMGSSS